MARVRGIGVAVIIRRCGSHPGSVILLPFSESEALPRSASRCATPKRCCSSMIASARFLNSTLSWMMAWVPITRPASPLLMSASISRRSLVFWLPVSQAVLTPSGSSQPMSLRKCCSANISVGAIKAHCQPASMQTAAASAATTVLPLPTSPCNSRCMGMGLEMSPVISAHTRCCAAVSLKGNAAKSRWWRLAFLGWGKDGARSKSRARLLCN